MISSEAKNLFIPDRRDCGLRKSVKTAIFRKKEYYGVRSGRGGNGWLPLEDNDAISEISCHDKVVLDDERRFLGV